MPADRRPADGGAELRHFESYADRQIREAIERGEFDDLPGAGRPLKDGDVYDPAWWAKGLVLRERVRDRADRVRRLLRDELPRLRAAGDEAAAQRVAELNRMIDEVNQTLPESDRIPRIRVSGSQDSGIAADC